MNREKKMSVMRDIIKILEDKIEEPKDVCEIMCIMFTESFTASRTAKSVFKKILDYLYSQYPDDINKYIEDIEKKYGEYNI